MQYQSILNEITSKIGVSKNRGKVATYIPELALVNPNQFGISLIDINNQEYHAGDAFTCFSIQSISKVFLLLMAFDIMGSKLWDRMGVEPSGDPFNQLALLELEKGIPRNPFINPGAIVICDILLSQLENPKEKLLWMIRRLADDDGINIDLKVALSEEKTGFTNYATAHLIKSFGNLKHSVAEVLDFYFSMCAIAMNCKQLARAFFPFFNQGRDGKGTPIFAAQKIKRINAIMLTCGFYDQAGEFAFEVGLPGKSGVGGGIVAVLPNKFAVATWSPGLNKKGNSTLGMAALEKLTTDINHSIF